MWREKSIIRPQKRFESQLAPKSNRKSTRTAEALLLQDAPRRRHHPGARLLAPAGELHADLLAHTYTNTYVSSR